MRSVVQEEMAGSMEHSQSLTDDELVALLGEPTVTVVELYADWCGPCKAVVPATKRMSEQEDAARLHFAQMCAERCEVLPSAKEHRGKSEPLFMLYQNGALVHRVTGADTPALTQRVAELLAAAIDGDSAALNPFAAARAARASRTV